MPFPDIDGTTAISNIATVAEYLGANAPEPVQKAAKILFEQIDIVSTRLYDDVQDLKAWRASVDKTYVPTDPQAR